MVMLKLEDQPLLIQAIFNGEIDNVKALLAFKPDVNYQDVEKRSPLHAAAYRGDTELAELLLEQGARVNTKDSSWLTPLHRACGVNADEMVELLLKHKADTTARDRQWQTPLHIAAAHNAIGCIQHLLTHITNVNVTDRSGCTALHHAALNGHNEVVQLLLANGSIINACDKKDCRPIHWASHLGHVDTVNILIQHGADINVKDRNQYTPLHAAVASAMVYVCSLLLNAGADVNAQNAFGNTPLHIACLNGHLSVCQILLAHDANLEACNYKGQTALHIAAASTQGVACLAYLLEQKIDINRQSLDGRTPLHMSAIYGRFTRSKRLIDKGAVVDRPDKNGNTALHIAAQYGHDILTATLLDFGADPTKRGYESRTPLHACCLSGFVEVCRKFLQLSIDFNVLDERGRSPIHCAAHKGSVECLDLLVSRGGDFKLSDAIGRTALHYAAGRGHYNCVYTLVGIGAEVNVLDSEGCSPLHLAAAYDLEGKCVEYLLAHRAEPLMKDVNGYTPIHYAVNGSNCMGLELLLKVVGKNVKFWGPDMPLTTPLHLAARRGELNILRAVITYFPYTNIKTSEGYTPLLVAAREGHTPNCQMLLRYGAKVNVADDVAGMTPVHHSAKNGHHHCLALLVDNAEVRTVIDQVDKYKRTALMLAVSGAHQDCALTLLKSGSDPNVVDADLHSPLFRAVVTDQNSVVQLLISCGAQLTRPDVNGKTVLQLAAACGHLKCLQKMMLSCDERDALVLDKNGFSALHWACYYGNAACLEFLLQMKVFQRLEGNVFTPVHCAAFTGSERCLEFLHRRFGVECLRARDSRQRTPLHLAAWHGHADCVRFLLDHGVEVEAKDEIGRSALISAAQNGQSQVIDLLLAHKAELKATDGNGNTALHVACHRKHNHTALLLLEYVNDLDIINMVDDEKKTALHLSARNGLVEVTAELIKKGASVTAIDSNGLTPALYCAPNACVAQCLAIILAHHPAPSGGAHTKDYLNNLLNLITCPSTSSTSFNSISNSNQSSQTDLSLLRNPHELFLVDIPARDLTQLRPGTGSKRLKCANKRQHNLNLKPLTHSPPTDKNLILIENYKREKFDVSNLKSQKGLNLHRSFSDMALVTSGSSTESDSGSKSNMALNLLGEDKENIDVKRKQNTRIVRKIKFVSGVAVMDVDSKESEVRDDELKKVTYQKLIEGYKSIALKMARVSSKFDVSVDDIQKAYIEQYQEAKRLKTTQAQQHEHQDDDDDDDDDENQDGGGVDCDCDNVSDSVSFAPEVNCDCDGNHEANLDLDPDLELEVKQNAQTAVEQEEEPTSIATFASFGLPPLDAAPTLTTTTTVTPSLTFASFTKVDAVSDVSASSDLEMAATTTSCEALMGHNHGDFLYENFCGPEPSKPYCDCLYVCKNCVLLNRYDFDQGDFVAKKEMFADDGYEDTKNKMAVFKTQQQTKRGSGGVVSDDEYEFIPLENLLVVDVKVFVGEGAIRKSRPRDDAIGGGGGAGPDKLKRFECKSKVKLDGCGGEDDGRGGVRDDIDALDISLDCLDAFVPDDFLDADADADADAEVGVGAEVETEKGECGQWPKVTFDEGRVTIPKDLTVETNTSSGNGENDSGGNPTRDLDWSLFGGGGNDCAGAGVGVGAALRMSCVHVPSSIVEIKSEVKLLQPPQLDAAQPQPQKEHRGVATTVVDVVSEGSQYNCNCKSLKNVLSTDEIGLIEVKSRDVDDTTTLRVKTVDGGDNSNKSQTQKVKVKVSNSKKVVVSAGGGRDGDVLSSVFTSAAPPGGIASIASSFIATAATATSTTSTTMAAKCGGDVTNVMGSKNCMQLQLNESGLTLNEIPSTLLASTSSSLSSTSFSAGGGVGGTSSGTSGGREGLKSKANLGVVDFAALFPKIIKKDKNKMADDADVTSEYENENETLQLQLQQEKELWRVIRHAQDRIQGCSYQEMMDFSEGCNLSMGAKAMARKLLEQAQAQAVDGDGGGGGTAVLSSDGLSDISLDSGIGESLGTMSVESVPSVCSVASFWDVAPSVGHVADVVEDEGVGVKRKLSDKCVKSRKSKKQDDTKCCLQ